MSGSGAPIVLLIAAVAFWGQVAGVGANLRPPKCCPRDKGLNSRLDCETTNIEHLLVPIDVSDRYPGCAKENITVIAAEEGNRIICLDKMLGDGSTRDSAKLIGLNCADNDTISREDFGVPDVLTIKKCCPQDRRYSNYTAGCWSSDFVSDNGTVDKLVRSLLNVSEPPGYIDIAVGAPVCKPYEVLVDYRIPKYQVLLLDTEAIEMRIPGNSEYIRLPPETICVDIDAGDDLTIVVRACQDETVICKNPDNTCIRKCCPDSKSMNNSASDCIFSKNIFNPQFYTDVNKKGKWMPLGDDAVYPSLKYGKKCEHGYLLRPWETKTDVMYLDTNGELYDPSDDVFFDRDSFCMDRLESENVSVSGVVTVMCFAELTAPPNSTSSYFILTGSGSIVSSFFLALTLIVYCCLPYLRNIHGKTIMCYIFSLLFGYMLLSINQMGSVFYNFVDDERLCRGLGYATLFWFLATFSWLNVLGFDIWLTFGSLQSPNYTEKKSSKSLRFFFYNLYSWGVTGIITIISALLDYAANSALISHTWVPDIGITSCFFSENTKGRIIFFLMPVAIQMFINILFFILTIKYYIDVKITIEKSSNSVKQRYHNDQKKLTMVLKLFVMMGITWTAEILSQVFKSDIWIILDLVNMLHGLLIFVLLVCKTKISKNVAKRTREIFSCFSKKDNAPQARANTSTVFTILSSECKL